MGDLCCDETLMTTRCCQTQRPPIQTVGILLRGDGSRKRSFVRLNQLLQPSFQSHLRFPPKHSPSPAPIRSHPTRARSVRRLLDHIDLVRESDLRRDRVGACFYAGTNVYGTNEVTLERENSCAYYVSH